MKKSYLLILILLTSCNSSKTYHLMTSGSVENDNFFEIISFSYEAQLPIIEAEINGQLGRFLFDTGAPNVISQEFAEKQKLKTLAYGTINDSGGHSLSNQSYVNLDKIVLGNVVFKNTGAVIQDLGNSEVMKCLNLDGIIGSNLMRKAIWKIDYQNKQITITDELDNLNITKEYNTISFKEKTQGTPLIDLNFDNVEVSNLTFDTGSNGNISLPTKALKVLQKQKEVKSTYAIGSTSYGVGGKAKTDTLYYGIIDHLKIGNATLDDKILEFSTHDDNIGNNYFENYDVILDWQNQKIYMLQLIEYKYNTIENFGFGIDWRADGLYVGSIYNDSNNTNKLKIGDQILRINESRFEHLSTNNICEMFKKSGWGYKELDETEIVIKRDSEVLEFYLYKKVLL
ncbi:aspartyl protease family protein [Winogradskyella sp.]